MASKDTFCAVIAKAWKDPNFKQKLFSNPHAAFKECGYNVPTSTKIVVTEASPGTLHFILPTSPTNALQLSEGELSKVAAAGGTEYCLPNPSNR